MTDTGLKQGATGKVLWFEGNMMPSIGREMPKGKPVVREIYFCKPTKMGMLKQEGSIFQDVNEIAIKSVKTDSNGQYKITLDAGKYSVFTKEESGFFANGFDGKNMINLIEVKEGEVTTFNIDINYQAVF